MSVGSLGTKCPPASKAIVYVFNNLQEIFFPHKADHKLLKKFAAISTKLCVYFSEFVFPPMDRRLTRQRRTIRYFHLRAFPRCWLINLANNIVSFSLNEPQKRSEGNCNSKNIKEKNNGKGFFKRLKRGLCFFDLNNITVSDNYKLYHVNPRVVSKTNRPNDYRQPSC